MSTVGKKSGKIRRESYKPEGSPVPMSAEEMHSAKAIAEAIKAAKKKGKLQIQSKTPPDLRVYTTKEQEKLNKLKRTMNARSVASNASFASLASIGQIQYNLQRSAEFIRENLKKLPELPEPMIQHIELATLGPIPEVNIPEPVNLVQTRALTDFFRGLGASCVRAKDDVCNGVSSFLLNVGDYFARGAERGNSGLLQPILDYISGKFSEFYTNITSRDYRVVTGAIRSFTSYLRQIAGLRALCKAALTPGNPVNFVITGFFTNLKSITEVIFANVEHWIFGPASPIIIALFEQVSSLLSTLASVSSSVATGGLVFFDENAASIVAGLALVVMLYKLLSENKSVKGASGDLKSFVTDIYSATSEYTEWLAGKGYNFVKRIVCIIVFIILKVYQSEFLRDLVDSYKTVIDGLSAPFIALTGALVVGVTELYERVRTFIRERIEEGERIKAREDAVTDYIARLTNDQLGKIIDRQAAELTAAEVGGGGGGVAAGGARKSKSRRRRRGPTVNKKQKKSRRYKRSNNRGGIRKSKKATKKRRN